MSAICRIKCQPAKLSGQESMTFHKFNSVWQAWAIRKRCHWSLMAMWASNESHFVCFSQKVVQLSVNDCCSLWSFALNCLMLYISIMFFCVVRAYLGAVPAVDFCNICGLSSSNNDVWKPNDALAKSTSRRNWVHFGMHVSSTGSWHRSNWFRNKGAYFIIFV